MNTVTVTFIVQVYQMHTNFDKIDTWSCERVLATQKTSDELLEDNIDPISSMYITSILVDQAGVKLI